MDGGCLPRSHKDTVLNSLPASQASSAEEHEEHDF